MRDETKKPSLWEEFKGSLMKSTRADGERFCFQARFGK